MARGKIAYAPVMLAVMTSTELARVDHCVASSIDDEGFRTAVTFLRLDIACITGYTRNPRRHSNPEYDRIKASIEASGLDQPLVVTQRPGEEHYVLHAGGNTRLRVLNELFQESGQARYRWVDCQNVPWSQESDVLLAHLRENELRGGLYFIDKAQAVFDAKQLFEEELGIEALTLRHLATLCRERGFNLNPGLISKLGYAVQRLQPLIPQALSAGLGRPQVEKIRALERAAYHLWEQYDLGSKDEFEDIFAALCQRYDSPDWDLQSLQQALENEIASDADQGLQVIRLALDAALAGRVLPALGQHVSDDQERDDQGVDNIIALDASEALHSTTVNTDHVDESELVPSISRNETAVVAAVEQPVDLNALRLQAYSLAVQLAQNNGLGDAIIPLLENGLGFLVTRTPSQSLSDIVDMELLTQVSTVWWQLFTYADMAIAPPEVLAETLDETTSLYQTLERQQLNALSDTVLTLPLEQTGYQFWRHLSDADWHALTALMDSYRQLHRLAHNNGLALWVSSKED